MTFGRAMLPHWTLDPGSTYLNHGTVGVVPRRVLQRQQALRDEIERHPSRFVLRELSLEQPAPWRSVSRLREAIVPVAQFVGATPDDLVFVSNVTTGMNAVLGSVPLTRGDEVVMTDLAYGAVKIAANAVCERAGAIVRTAHVEYPFRQAQIIDAIVGTLTPHTKLVVVDHITAQTALILPVAAIARECHARGVPVLVDGAHVPGAIPLDISGLGVDWYAANLHKWAHAPRGCGMLWAAPERQPILRHPIISWGRDRGFLHEFEHTPTADPTSYLAAPEGIALLQEWDSAACAAYMHDLAWTAGELLADAWGTEFTTPREMIGAMVTVPLPHSAGTTDGEAARLRVALLVDDHIEVQLHAWRERLWVRVSAQVYNDRSDIERLAQAVARRRPRSTP
ncbi:MAG TPA: aminotransferase class V-fold PLP-dependent enzyme [Vicinamibacterales bacterium]|nr:aminotransferase class V-fold PLP-dependent enzyme [Vicinamibacterales bacterium]